LPLRSLSIRRRRPALLSTYRPRLFDATLAGGLLLCGFAIAQCSWAADIDWPTRREQIRDMIRNNALGEGIPTAEELAGMSVAPFTRAILPRKVDLSDGFPMPGSQGALNSCSGWATAYVRSYYAHASEGVRLDDTASLPSPQFIYDAESVLPDDRAKDADDCFPFPNIAKAALVLAEYGAPNIGSYKLRAGRHECRAIGKAEVEKWRGNFQIEDAKLLSGPKIGPFNPDSVKEQLATATPVIVGMDIGEDFSGLEGGLPYSGPPQGITGGHALAVVGYDDDRQAFRIINSWSTKWGDEGFAWISYDYMRQYVHAALVLIPKTPIKPHNPFVNLQTLGCGDAPDNTAAQRPKAQCDMLEALRAPLGESDLPKVAVAGNATLKAGDRLAIEIETPGFPSYIDAFYLQADRRVVHLVQTDPMAPKQYPPHTKLFFGDGVAGHGSFRVSPPFGDELIVAIASRSPLFDAKRPQGEPDAAVVAALQQALTKMGPKPAAARDVAAWFTSLRTQP
jgi:hypothetical protein